MDAAIGARLHELDAVAGQIYAQNHDQNIVGPIVSDYNDLMSSTSSRRITSQSELLQVIQSLLDIRKRAEAAKRQVSSASSKSTLTQVMDAIDKNLSKS